MNELLTNRRWLDVAAVGAVCALACRGASNLFADAGWVAPIAVALILGALAAIVPSARRMPLPTTLLVGLAVVIAGLVAYASAADGSDSVRTVVAGGWSQLLTVVLPAETSPANLAPVLTVAAIGAFVAALGAWRSGSALLPLLGPLLIVGGLSVLSGGRSPFSAVGALLVAVGALGFVLWRTLGSERQAAGDRPLPFVPPSRPLAVLGAAHLALAVLGGSLLGGAVVALGRDRFEPRDHVHAKVTDDRFVSPLADYKSLITDDRQSVVATVKPGTTVPEVRLRLVVLDRYDGTTWSSAATYRSASQALPGPPANVPTPGETTSFQVDVKDLKWRWLPTAPGYPIRLTGTDGLTVDPATGMVRADGVNGRSYTVVTATVPPANLDELAAVEPRPPAAERAIEFEPGTELPGQLQTLITTVANAGPAPLQQLQALKAELAKVRYADSAPPGHSLGVLESMLQNPDVGGTAEHFAATFALVANLLSNPVPTRLAIGLYEPGEHAGGSPVDLTTRNYHVWPEVNLRSTGWTPVRLNEAKPKLDANTRTSAPPTTVVASPTPTAPAATASTIAPTANSGSGNDGGGLPLLSGPWRIPVVIVLLAGLASGAIMAAKSWKTRRRRTTGNPRERVVGAWLDLSDRMSERGVPYPAAQTPKEFARVAGERFGPITGEVVIDLSRHVDNAVFGDHEVDEAEVAAVWADVDRARKEADRQLNVADKARARLNLRTLVRQ